jgi:hypothetical protein
MYTLSISLKYGSLTISCSKFSIYQDEIRLYHATLEDTTHYSASKTLEYSNERNSKTGQVNIVVENVLGVKSVETELPAPPKTITIKDLPIPLDKNA